MDVDESGPARRWRVVGAALAVAAAAIALGVVVFQDSDPPPAVAEPNVEVLPPPDPVEMAELVEPTTPSTSPLPETVEQAEPVQISTGATATTQTVRLSGAGTVSVAFDGVDENNRARYTAIARYVGDMRATVEEHGVEQYDPDNPPMTTYSTGEGTFEGTIELVGYGSAEVVGTNVWWSDSFGHVNGTSTFEAVGGDLVGMTATVRWSGIDNVQSLGWQGDFEIPTG